MDWKLTEPRTETGFSDGKPPYTATQAVAEANRCLYCHDAPCIKACPTNINIPQFIRKISTGNIRGSAQTIFDANILGHACAKACPVEELCVGACVYNDASIPPIQIGRLQQYSTAIAIKEGWQLFTAGPDTGKSVALIGAGPASIACAHELRRYGHACTIYEKAAIPGGLNVTGIAPYKLQGQEALQEIAWVAQIGGITIKTGVEIGKDIGWQSLEEQHDAIFVGLGLGPDRRLPGADLPGIEGAVAFIERMKTSTVDLKGVQNAIVIGGGNTAMDCLRELCLLGIPNVTMVYRGPESKMSGYKHEWEAAKKLGAHAIFSANPIGFDGQARVSALHIRSQDQDQTIPAQLVLLAIGQARLGEQLQPLDITTAPDGRLLTAPDGRLTRPRWYAGGDCANGGKEVVNAVAEGKTAARTIHRQLTAVGI